MDIAVYLEQVRAAYASGHATEHSYRPALHALFRSIDPTLTVINEPKKSEAGMPDFLFERDGVPLGCGNDGGQGGDHQGRDRHRAR